MLQHAKSISWLKRAALLAVDLRYVPADMTSQLTKTGSDCVERRLEVIRAPKLPAYSVHKHQITEQG